MPEYDLKDTILTSLNAQEPWPENVKLFQPYEVEQILLPDNASCLAVQAFLKMCNLPFEVEMRWNAEFMSPSGRVPFIKCGAFVVSELEPIVQFAANKGVTLTAKLSTEEKAEMRAYMSLITNVLVNAELYISWIDNDTYNAVTRVRNASVYPWPLGWIQTRSKRAAVIKRLKALHWNEKTLQSVLNDVEQCCNSLTQRLGDKDYFFGTNPTPLDALMYGHVRALLSATGPKAALMIKPITSPMLRLLLRITTLTKMKLTPQEEYLISQAFQVTKRRLSPNRVFSDRNTRIRKSKLCARHSSREVSSSTMFGYKSFGTSKNTSMQLKDDVPCECEPKRLFGNVLSNDEEQYDFIAETLDAILYKVEELTNFKEDFSEHPDFEIIVYPPENINVASRNDSPINRFNEGLHTIDENVDAFENGDVIHYVNDDYETVDTSVVEENVIKIIYDEDSEVSSKPEVEESIGVSQDSHKIYSQDSSNPRKFKEDESLVSGTTDDKTLLTFDAALMEQVSTDSKSTLVRPSNEDISVENLLKYLRKQNAANKEQLSMPDPTELDALVFGHVFTIITTRLPCRKLAETVRKFDTLVALAKRIDEQYFKRP